MELISKISKGTNMDQIYIPKNRYGFHIGEFVVIKPIETEEKITLHYNNVKQLEPVKVHIIESVFEIIQKKIHSDNIIVTGSFLEKGYGFKDLDIIIISNKKVDLNKEIEKYTGIKTQIISISNSELIKGLETDPLYENMLSKCVSLKRIIYNIKRKIDYKVLDFHLLKSELLIINYNTLKGDEKYYLIRNLIAICLFIKNKKISKDSIEKEIKKVFDIGVEEIFLDNLNKDFLNKYKKLYKTTFKEVMEYAKQE